MKRDIEKHLQAWKSSTRRKPLIINGARQVGKTYSLKSFGTSAYREMVYLNFEKDEKLSHYFDQTLDPKHLIKTLSLHSGKEIEPGRTLLIFDEIQECPKALNSLKYFFEEAKEYHIASAGSLLGVKTAQSKGFPVGKVNFLHLYPLTFFEFLSAIKEEKLRTLLEGIESFEPLPLPLHEKLIDLLKQYLFVGGMPEAVFEYTQHEKLSTVREVQLEILEAYEKDFAKHAPPHDVIKITTVWKQIHRQLAKENKKFLFAAIRKSARGRDYETALQWLIDAGLIHKSFLVETPKLPLSAYAKNNIFKLFLLDVGLLGAQSRLSPKTVIEGNLLFTEFKGSLTENFVAGEIISKQNLYYWSSQGTAEVDFLIEKEGKIYPLEVKSATSQKKKSLLVYGEKYKAGTLLRASLRNLNKNGKIYNYPLYMVSQMLKKALP